MFANKALITAAVLAFTAPAVPALAHDDEGANYWNRWGYHRNWNDGRYIRCLACPWNRDHYGWRGYGWPYRYGGYYGGWHPYYRHYYGGWRYRGWDS